MKPTRPRANHPATARRRGPSRFSRGWLKRGLDLVVALGVLVALLPLLLPIAVTIGIAGGWPVLYAHPRIGRGGRPFRCLKFRTMVRDADGMLAAHLAGSSTARAEWERSRKLRDDPRVIGGVGRWLRTSSLDELPQLLNVLKGDMSVVGPRPIVADELPLYHDGARWYLSVRPGLTGPWQVGGRSDTSYTERVALDVHYAKHATFRRDLGIILRTIWVMVRGRGAY